MHKDIESILYTEEILQEKIAEVAKQISNDYGDTFPLVIGILKGSTPFMMDLIRKMDILVEIDFMAVSSYGNNSSTTGEVKILKDLNHTVEGRDVIIVEDIIDTGLTLSYLVELFGMRRAKSVKVVTLLDKPAGRKVDINPDYKCLDVPDAFIVGYGLDYAEKYRNFPYIGILKEEVYTK